MAPPKYRGGFNIGFNFCVGLGVLLANLINYGTEKIKGGWGWRVSLAMAALLALILTLGLLFLPETPNSLIQHSNRQEKAKQMLQRVRGTDDVEAEFDDRTQLVMSIAIPFFQQVTGINVVTFYAPVLFRTIGLGESASLMSAVLTGLVHTSTAFVASLIVRVLFTVGGVQMFVSQMLVGGIMGFQLGDHGGLSKGYAIMVSILICIYVLGWLVPSEIYPLEIRSARQSITVAVGFLLCFVVAQTFLAMLCHFKHGIFFFFGGWVAVITIFVYMFLPETKNVPIEQMERIWRKHWFWKRFVVEEYEVSKVAGA